MRRRLTARLGHDDGQTTVLTVGLCAVLVALMLVMLAVTTVQLQHRRLQSLADSAAIAGAEELGFRLGEDPGLARFIESMARRVDGRMVSPELDDLGAAVVGSYLGDRSASTYRDHFGDWAGGRGFWVG